MASKTYQTLAVQPLLGVGGFGPAVEKTLSSWGIKSCVRDAKNMAQDSVGINIAKKANSPDLWAFGSRCVLYQNRVGTRPGADGQPTQFSGGNKVFVGWRMKQNRSSSPRMQQFKYMFTGPWGFFLERHEFQKAWPSYDSDVGRLVLVYRSQVVLGQGVATITQANGVQTTQMTLAEQASEIVNFTIGQTVTQFGSQQFVLDANFENSNFDGVGGWNGYCPLDAANDITCAEALKKTLKMVPSVSIWFDYSTPVPTMHIATRDTLPSATLAYGNSLPSSPYGNYTSEIERLDELVPPAVCYKYRVTQTINTNGQSQQLVTIYTDIACAAGTAFGVESQASPAMQRLLPFAQYFSAELATFDFEGATVNQVSASITTTPLATNSLAFWKELFPDLNSTAAFVNLTISGALQSGGAIPPQAVNVLTGGQVAPWMFTNNDPQSGSPAIALPIILEAQFTVLDANPAPTTGATNAPTKNNVKTKTWRGVATNLSTGTFSATSITAPYDPVPTGLAEFVYNLEKTFHYSGKHGIKSVNPATGFPAVADPCPIGTNLNLSGYLAEYASMNAQVQSASYDYMNGSTEYTFGTPSHLSAADLVDRLRINRGPRWYYQIGGNLTNASSSASATLGFATPGDAPAGGAESPLWQFFPADLLDYQQNAAAYQATTPPGVTHYGGSAAATFAGLDAGPGINIQYGLGGEPSTGYIRLTFDDLHKIFVGLTQQGIRLRALQTCEGTVDNPAYRVFVCSPAFFPGANWTPPQ